MIYVTHRIEEIPAGFTHALLLREGRATARGRMDQVLNSRNLSACFRVAIKVSRWRNRYYAMVDN